MLLMKRMDEIQIYFVDAVTITIVFIRLVGHNMFSTINPIKIIWRKIPFQFLPFKLKSSFRFHFLLQNRLVPINRYLFSRPNVVSCNPTINHHIIMEPIKISIPMHPFKHQTLQKFMVLRNAYDSQSLTTLIWNMLHTGVYVQMLPYLLTCLLIGCGYQPAIESPT